MKSKPNQVSWEERFDELGFRNQKFTRIISKEPHVQTELVELKLFISSILKEERQRVIDRVQEEMYEKDPNETDTQIMDRLWELLKELEVSKLSKGEI